MKILNQRFREVDLDAPMDPEAMYARMLLAVMTTQVSEARRAARELRSWILHDGPPPDGYNPVHVLIRCRDTLDWCDRMQAGPERADESDPSRPALDCGR